MTKINTKALGLSFGVLWGFAVLFVGLMATFFNLGTGFVEIFSDFYFGYNANLIGSFVGCFWGFIDGFVGGIIIAWLYNKFSK